MAKVECESCGTICASGEFFGCELCARMICASCLCETSGAALCTRCAESSDEAKAKGQPEIETELREDGGCT